MKKNFLLTLFVFLALTLAGCSTAKPTEAPPEEKAPTALPEPTEVPPEPTPTEEPAPPTPTGPLTLTSTSFENEGVIPIRYGISPFNVQHFERTFICDGSEEGKENISPALAWTNVPLEAESLVLIMTDFMHYAHENLPEEAVFPHWIIYNIPPDAEGFAEAKPGELILPEGAAEGNNNFPEAYTEGYGGPCPPMGEEHLYIFTIYALDTILDVEPGIRRNNLNEAMTGHIIAEAEWRGYYTNQ